MCHEDMKSCAYNFINNNITHDMTLYIYVYAYVVCTSVLPK